VENEETSKHTGGAGTRSRKETIDHGAPRSPRETIDQEAKGDPSEDGNDLMRTVIVALVVWTLGKTDENRERSANTSNPV
jgi:hypothetical protein